LSKQGRDYRQVVGTLLKQKKIEPMEARLSVEVHIHPRDRRKIDIDNRIKPLLDALQYGWAFIDDNQIDELHVYRKEIILGGQCFVKITELGA
jgi:Holliday junction resolvase RusA-like endonuclease